MGTDGDQRIELLLELGEAELGSAPRAALARADEALGILGDREDAQTVRALRLQGRAHDDAGEFPAAIEHLGAALTLQRRLVPGGPDEAELLLHLADVHLAAGDLSKVADLDAEATAIAEREGHVGLTAQALVLGGTMLEHQGHAPEALPRFEEALQRAREAGDLPTELRAAMAISKIAAKTGGIDEAMDRLESVLRTAREHGLKSTAGWALNMVALLHNRLGRGEEVLRYADEARRIAVEIGNRFLEADATRIMYGGHLLQGDVPRARQCAWRATEMLKSAGARLAHANALSAVAQIHMQEGEFGQARAVSEEVVEASTAGGYAYGQFVGWRTIAICHGEQGEFEAALAALDRALEAATETDDEFWIAAAHDIAAEVYEAMGDTKRALERFRLFHRHEMAATQAGSEGRLELLRVRHEVARANREAEEARTRQRAVLEQTPHLAMHAYDAQGDLRIWNDAARTTYGWTEEERAGRTAEELFCTTAAFAAFEQARKAVTRDRASAGPFEWPFRRKDGTTGVCSTTLAPLVDADGEPLVVRMDLDITAHRQAMEDLEQSHALSRGILDSLHAGVAVLDGIGRVVAANDQWLSLHEETVDRPEDVGVGSDYLELCRRGARGGSADDARAHAGIEAVLAGRETSYEDEFLAVSAQGERWYRMFVGPLMGDQGGVVIAREDVTPRKQTELEREAALTEVRALKEQLEAENLYLAEELRREHDFGEIVGESDRLRAALELVPKVAVTDVTVLLLGETGTGKELFARAIHANSRRSDRPLVKVDCASLPSGLIESELLGHEKGAFTGADRAKPGRFEQADGGTIFLDEVGELPPELQTKLLRVLQDGEFERLGSTEVRKVDVRVIAATNRKLADAARSGGFRADLYYRLNGFPIEIPPLRARAGDVPLLVWHFVRRNQERLGKKIERIHSSSMEALDRYTWPGNVRELFSVVERAMILSTGPTLTDLVVPAEEGTLGTGTLEDAERAHILSVLEACGWRIKGEGNAADRLGLPPSTLRHRMKRLGIVRM